MHLLKSKILSNINISSDFYEMTISWSSEKKIKDPLPGQFLSVRVTENIEPLLRRPFAFSNYDSINKTIKFIYKKRGKATDLLSKMNNSYSLDLIGPLGNSFKKPENNKNAIILAGGIGLGPMLYLNTFLKDLGVKTNFIFGSRTKGQIPIHKELQNPDTIICTDDGSAGFKGNVLDYLKKIDKKYINNSIIYACGPTPMLKASHNFAIKNEICCSVSMEQIMACSVGACMGCVIKVKSGYARVCKEGPVFNSKDIVWQ